MAVFKIIASRQLAAAAPFEGTAVFEVIISKYDLKVGDTFTVFDTHHPVGYKIREIEKAGGTVTLFCEPGLGYENQFVGGTVNTEGSERIERFNYSNK